MVTFDAVIPPGILLGLSGDRLCEPPGQDCLLQPEVIEPLACLQQAALREGFNLVVASSYRSFERQLAIWNAKVKGSRPVLDGQGYPLDIHSLDDWQKIQAILRWSALPGTSRHHWGTDMDVYDAAAVPSDYQLQLTQEECDGPFAPFHAWLGARIAAGESYGFYRPYNCDRGGVAPEPWHLSYGPLADQFAAQLTESFVYYVLLKADMELKNKVLEHLSEIWDRYVRVPPSPFVSGNMGASF